MDTEQVATIGKDAFVRTFEAGQFFFPKVVAEFVRDGEIQVYQYDTGYDSYLGVLKLMLAQGPIVSAAHTSDSYHVLLSQLPPKEAEAVYERLRTGETSATELFNEGYDAAYESLHVIHCRLVAPDKVETEFRFLPYKRHPRRIEWLTQESPPPEATPKGRYVVALEEAVKASYAFAR